MTGFSLAVVDPETVFRGGRGRSCDILHRVRPGESYVARLVFIVPSRYGRSRFVGAFDVSSVC